MDCVFSSPGANKIRVIAIVCMVVAILQLAFAAAAASVVAEEIVGSWWCGLTILLTCILTGLKATNMCSVVCAIIFGIVSIVLACVATFIDSILAAHFDDLEACAGGGKVFGTGTAAAQSCAFYNPQYSCVCTDNDYYSSSECWGYDIHDDFDCGYLLDEVPSNLGLSALFAGISIITTIVFSCIACAVTCCPTSCGHYDPNFAAETPPPAQQQMTQQQGVPVYQGQPQGGVPMQQGMPMQQGQVMYQQNPQIQGQVMYQQNPDPSAMKQNVM